MSRSGSRTQARPRIPKWLKWEFWPFWFFYIPVYFQVIILAIRSRTLSFFTLANPGMRLGGFSNYSKYDVMKQLESRYLPKSFLFEKQPAPEDVLQAIHQLGISFPVILKPDEGERGWKVEKIINHETLENYLSHAPDHLLLQEYINLPEEYGVMYYRMPGEKRGHISSVMKREFLSVTGDGKSTLLELFHGSERCLYHLPRLKLKFHNELDTVLPAGEKKVLEEIG